MQIVPEIFGCLGRGLGSQEKAVPAAAQGKADFLLAVGVGPRGIEEGKPAVQGLLEQIGGLVPGDALDGQSAEAVFLDGDAGAAQSDVDHGMNPAFCFFQV